MRISDWSSDVCSSDLLSGIWLRPTITPSNSGSSPIHSPRSPEKYYKPGSPDKDSLHHWPHASNQIADWLRFGSPAPRLDRYHSVAVRDTIFRHLRSAPGSG